MPGRLVLLLASPRTAPGLLSRDAWTTLEAADSVHARRPGEPLADAVVEAGIAVAWVDTGTGTGAGTGTGTGDADGGHGPEGEVPPPVLARSLVGAAADGLVVWAGSADGDPGLSDAVAAEVTRLPDPPEVEVLVGSWDVPGARMLDVVAVIDRLRSPGGCPWDAEQTHASLARYLLEEAHETVEAIGSGDRAHLVEELGDVLLQVVFQARVGEDDPVAPFDVDAVAGGLVEKLLRRHPHVFAAGDATTPEEVERSWERIKAAEKDADGSGTGGLADGLPRSLPALLRAEKVLGRWERRGGAPDALVAGAAPGVAAELLALVAAARAEGLSAEVEVLRVLADLEAATDGLPPGPPG